MHDEYRMPLGGGKQASQPLTDIDCINKKEDDMTILDSNLLHQRQTLEI